MKKALENFLNEKVAEGENEDEFVCEDGIHYEVVTKQDAIIQAKDYAKSEGVNENISDTEIEYWVPLTGSEFWYREL